MSDFVAGNAITLLRNGTDFFPALLRAIEAAQHEIHLQTYIYEDDSIGIATADALKRAAARGVSTCLLLDGFGSNELSRDFVQELRQANVTVLYFRPKISPWTLKRNRLRRLHRKIAVIDGVTAFVGGINIIDDMNTPGHTPPRIDYAVRVEGPLVATIRASARYLWRQTAWTHLQRVNADPLPWRPLTHTSGNMLAAYVVRDNIRHRRDIERVYLEAIEGARREIVIANSYFLPGLRFRRALVAAARRGIRVVLLLQARVEYVLLDYATRALYWQFLAAGVEIHEYHASFMHSKVAVIDGAWATVGSSNIDPFSLLLAYEANVVVDDAMFARELRLDLEWAIRSQSHRVHIRDWKRASRTRRLFARINYNLMRFMQSLIGYPDK